VDAGLNLGFEVGATAQAASNTTAGLGDWMCQVEIYDIC
jgi:hypothetical protein